MTSIDVTDVLPANIAYLSVSAISPTGSPTTTPTVGVAATNNRLVMRFPTVTGTASSTDLSFTVNYFVPFVDAAGVRVLDPSSGANVVIDNQASFLGNWTPIDTRDRSVVTGNVTQITAKAPASFTAKPLAVQKSSIIVTDNAPSGLSPGDIIEYTVQQQVSDYFTMDHLVVTDLISDGQRLTPGFVPTYSVTQHGATSSGPFAPANSSSTIDTGGGSSTGATTFALDVSSQLTADTAAGVLRGGCVPAPGITVPNCSTTNDGATTATVKFRTTVQSVFTDAFPPQNDSVDQGDTINDTVSATARILSNATFAPTGSPAVDTSGVSLVIQNGVVSKSVYAVNGVLNPTAPYNLSPADAVTYRIRYTLPLSRVEKLQFVDYLPLPLFSSTEVTTFDATAPSAAVPAAGHFKFGPSDTFEPLSGITPTLTTATSDNTIKLVYGDFSAATPQLSTIDLLFTVTSTTAKSVDGLLFTNQVQARSGTTNSGIVNSTAIIQVVRTEPIISAITKGVVATSATSTTFSPTTTGPVSFNAPGTAGSRFTGTINSTNLTATPIQSDLSGVDAGDLVTFAIAVPNTGTGINGAFDIKIRDVLPAGFAVPATGNGLNLRATDGTGATFTTTDLGGGLFGTGVQLDDPGPTATPTGGLDAFSATSGRNVAIITYDLVASTSITPGSVLTNSAHLDSYSGSEGGPNYLTSNGATVSLTDSADVTVRKPTLAKTIVTTSEASTTGNNLTVGEVVRYRLAMAIPEGTSPAVVINDNLPIGLTYLNDGTTKVAFVSTTGSMTSSAPGLSGGTVNLTGSSPVAPTSPLPSTSINTATTFTSGVDPVFSLGDIVNGDSDADTEYVVLEFNAIAANVQTSIRGTSLSNTASVFLAGSPTAVVTSTAVASVVQTPNVAATKTVVTNPVANPDAGDSATYTLTIKNSAATNAVDGFDLRVSDTLPSGLTLDTASISITPSGGASGLTNTSSGNSISLTIDKLPIAGNVIVTYTATIDSAVGANAILTNGVVVTYTDLPGNGTAGNATGSFTPGAAGAVNGDRDGSGGTTLPNNYKAISSANVTVAAPTLTKTVAASSEPSTAAASVGPPATNEQVAIGEVVRYRLTAVLPEGQIVGANIVDQLPTGMQFVNDGTTRVAFVADSSPGIVSSGAKAVTAANVIGSAPVTPTTVLTAATNITPSAFGDGTDPTFALGDLVNSDSDSNSEYVVIEFNAIVLDVTGNSTGTTLSNTFSFRNSTTQLQISPAVVATVVVPVLTTVKTTTPTPTSVDGGDTFDYVVTVTNGNGANDTTAFDAKITDVVPASLMVTGHPTLASSGVVVGLTDDNLAAAIGNSISISAVSIAKNSSVTITIPVTVASSVVPVQTLANTANTIWTSLPGANGSGSSATGSATPGSPGAATGERIGSIGVTTGANNLFSTSTISLAVPSASVTKVVSVTSLSNTSGSNVVPGEVVTYQITVGLPEGTTPAYQLTDNIPAGMQYVANSVALDATGFAGTAGTMSANAPAADGADLVLNLTPGTVSTNNVATDNSYTITYRATVLDIATNAKGTTLANTVTPTVILTGTTPAVNVTDHRVDMTVGKTDSGVTGAGADITYTITYKNAGDQDATGVVLTETVPANTAYDIAATPGWACLPTAAAGSTCTKTIGAVAAAASGSTTFAVTVANPLPAGVTTTSNTVAIADDHISGSDFVPADNTKTISTTLTAVPDFTITKADNGHASPGSTIVYSIAYANIGKRSATGVKITETVPANTAFVPAAPGNGVWTCAANSAGSICTSTIGALTGLTGVGSRTFTVQAGSTFTAGTVRLSNTTTIDDDHTNGTDPNLADNSATVLTPIDAAPDLRVVKGDGGVTNATIGTTVQYTLAYSNNGTRGATGVVLHETVPANTTFVSGSPSTAGWSCAVASAGGTCSLAVGTLQPGGSGNAVFAVKIVSSLPAGVTQVTNTSTIDDDGVNGTDANTADNSSTKTTPVAAAPDLKILKTDNGVSTGPNGVVKYTLTSSNIGNQAATGVVVIEHIPANSSFDAADSTAGWTCVATVPTSLCTFPVGALDAAGPAVDIVFAVTTANSLPSGATQLSNTATVDDDHGNGIDPNTADNSATETTPIVTGPDLTITKSDGGATSLPGGTTAYTLAWANSGRRGAGGVVITETVPAHTTYSATGSSTGWSCTPASGAAGATCAFALGTVAVGGNGTTLFAVTAASPAPARFEQIDNTATIADDGINGPDLTPADNTASDSTPIVATPDLSIAKSDGGVSIGAGGSVAYTLTYSNVSTTQDASGVVLTETVPAHSTFTAAGSTAGWACAPNATAGSTCTLAIGPVGAGLGGSATFAVRADGTVPTHITQLANTATIADDGLSGADADLTNNTASDTTPVAAAPNLTVVKTALPTTSAVSGHVVYTLAYSNSAGTQDADGVVLTETVPSDAVFMTIGSSTGWSCANGSPSGTVCLLAVGSVVAGATGSATFAIDIALTLPAGTTSTRNTVSIADDGTNGTDLDPTDNTSFADVSLTAQVDLVITKSDGGISTVPGATVPYTLAYSNIASLGATGVTITETVPAGTTFDLGGSTQTPAWSCADGAASGTTCTILVGGVAAGNAGNGSVTFSVKVDEPFSTGSNAVANTATIADDGTNGPDADSADNTATDTTPVVPTADVQISKTGPTGTQQVSTQITYTLDVTNAGPNAAAGVVVTDAMPTGITAVSASGGPDWTCTVASTSVSCSYNGPAPLAKAAPQAISVVVSIDANAPVSITNTATVAASTFDPVLADNSSAATIRTQTLADLVITKTHVPLRLGQASDYTIAVANNGPSTAAADVAHPVVVTDNVPAGLTVTGVTPGAGWDCSASAGSSISCAWTADILVGSPPPVIHVAVNVDTTAPTSITNSASVAAGPTTDPVLADNTVDDPGAVTPEADVSIVKTAVGSFPTTGTGVFHFVVADAGPSVAVGPITVTDHLDVGLDYASVSSVDAWSCAAVPAAVGSDVTCTLAPDLMVTQTTEFDITVAVSSSASTAIANTASVTSPTDDPVLANNSSSIGVGTTVAPAADLGISKVHAGNFQVGSTGVYTLTVRSFGPNDAVGPIVVDDTLPAGLSVDHVDALAPWVCTTTPTNVSCTQPGPLTAGTSATDIVVTVDVAPNAVPGVTNTATVAAPSGIADTNPANDTASDPAVVTPLADLSIVKSHSGTFKVGDDGTFVLTVTNNGPNDHPGGFTVTDTLPTSVAFVSATGPGWVCTSTGQQIDCAHAATLTSGATSAVTVVATVIDPTVTTVANTASVDGGSTLDPDSTNNTSTDTVAVAPTYNLTIAKQLLTSTLTAGAAAVYRITVTNQGPTGSSKVITVVDTLPTGLTFVSWSGTGWACSAAGQVLTCTNGMSMPVNSTSSVELTTTVAAGAAGGAIQNSASVSIDGGDSSTGDNAVSAVAVTVAAAPQPNPTPTAVVPPASGQPITDQAPATTVATVPNVPLAAPVPAATLPESTPTTMVDDTPVELPRTGVRAESTLGWATFVLLSGFVLVFVADTRRRRRPARR